MNDPVNPYQAPAAVLAKEQVPAGFGPASVNVRDRTTRPQPSPAWCSDRTGYLQLVRPASR